MGLYKIDVSNAKIPEKVMNCLIGEIESGHMQVGEELPPERGLVETLGVGRGSVRESLAVLEFMGVIESRGNRKIVSKDADYFKKAQSLIRLSERENVHGDFMEFRRCVELAIARLASERATEEDLERLRLGVERLERNQMDMAADVQFHQDLAMASHNMIFATILDFVNYMILDLRTKFHNRADYHAKTVAAHRHIYEAIKSRDPAAAAQAMDSHLCMIENYFEDANEHDAEVGIRQEKELVKTSKK